MEKNLLTPEVDHWFDVFKMLLEEKVASSKLVHTCDYSSKKIMKIIYYWLQSFDPSCFHTLYHSLLLTPGFKHMTCFG